MLQPQPSAAVPYWALLLCLACSNGTHSADTANSTDTTGDSHAATPPSVQATARDPESQSHESDANAIVDLSENDSLSPSTDQGTSPEDANIAPTSPAVLDPFDGGPSQIRDGGPTTRDAGDGSSGTNADTSDATASLPPPPPMATIPLQPFGDGNCGGVHCSAYCCPAPLYCQMTPCSQ